MTRPLRTRSAAETEGAVLDLVRSGGVLSRVELAEQSGLTGASISRVVKRLLDRGLLVETGQGARTGGKRRTLLELGTGGRYAVGVSVDHARLTYVLVNLRGEVVASVEAPGIGQDPPVAVVRRAAQGVRELLDGQELCVREVAGVGVAVPGRLDPGPPGSDGSSRLATEWERLGLEAVLGEALDLPVRVEHDHVSAALGEFWVGKVPASASFACVYLSEGFGLGLRLRGDVHRGASRTAGEVGHMVLDAGGAPCWCGSRGCLDALAGPAAVVARVMASTAGRELGLTGSHAAQHREFSTVCRAAADHDGATAGRDATREACREAVEASARYVGTALLSIVNVLDLDRIVLAGPGFDEAGPLYADSVRAEVERRSSRRETAPVTVELSGLGLYSAAVGAATTAFQVVPGGSGRVGGYSS